MTNIEDSLESRIVLSEEKIKNLFDSIPAPSYVWQRSEDDFILVDFNKAADKVTNGKIQKMLYEKVSVIQKDRPDIIEALDECYYEKKRVSKKFKYVMKTTGKEVYLRAINYYIPPDLIIVHIKDLTTQVQIENELISSEKQYRELFEHSPVPIVLLNLKGVIIDHNIATEKQFGYQKAELIGMNYLNLTVYPADQTPILKDRFLSLIQGKSVDPVEVEIFKKDGTKVWIFSEINVINYKNEQSILAFILDITERKEFEKKINWKLDIEKLLSKISSTFIGNINIDEAINKSLLDMGTLIGATRAYILFYNEENSLEFYAQEWCTEKVSSTEASFIAIKPEDYPWSLKKYEEDGFFHVKNVEDLPEDAKLIKNTLKRLKVNSLIIFPIKIKGELYGFIGFDNIEKSHQWEIEDFELLKTSSEIIGSALDRKWSEETLKSSHQLLAGIISSMVESICLIDSQFNIVWANNVAKQLFGLKLKGKKCYTIFFKRGKPCESCIALKTFTDGKIHEKEAELQSVDDKKLICWCTSSTAGMSIDGETEYAVLIYRDITKRKNIEHSLRESEQNLVVLNETLKERVIERTRELKASEENYKRILNNLDVGFYKGEFHGPLLMHNQAVNKILGINEKVSLVGVKTEKFFVDSEVQKRYYEGLINEGYIRNFNADIKNPDGKIIKVQLNSHLIKDKNGSPKEVEGTIILVDKN